jgi:hypothetical protein
MHAFARHLRPLPALLLGLGLVNCADEGSAPEDLPTIVEAGKADNFLAVSAREYWIEGRTNIVLDASWTSKTEAEREAEVKRLIPYRQVVIGWFLNRYIVEKDPKEADASYGGFKALTKNGSYEDMNLTKVDELTWSFDFRQEVAGKLELIDAIPDKKANADGSWSFDLVMGKVSTTEMQRLDTDREWYRSSPWGSFTSTSVGDDRKELITLTIRPQVDEDDAWIDQERLYADGKLTVGIHFGWDYHNAYHEVHSKAVYNWLVNRKGFKSPVAAWEDLRHDAGPLTGEVTWRGKKVAVEISIFWGRKGDASDPDTAAGGLQLERDMLESLASREVIIFNGHSGPFYGFALANWRMTSEGDLDDSELAAVELLTGSYQVIVAEGCDTYAIGQAFYDNPYKPALEDLDVVTTTSFSNASSAATVTDFLSILIGAPGSKVATPTLYSKFLEDADSNSYWFTTMYGVHGIDDNPRIHPFADLTKNCATCTKASDCGAGMYCVTMADGSRGCAAECTASYACGKGYTCRNTRVQSYLNATVCAPEGLSCKQTTTARGVPVINEIMPNPNADFNADGRTNSVTDEYIEIVNAGAGELDLSGWRLADAVGARHIFPANTRIPPGGALIVFGGGTPKLVAGTTLVQTASTKALALNNGGDKVVLSDLDGRAVSLVEYKSGILAGQSWQRVTDAQADAAFATASPSPGARRDQSQF